MPRVQHVKDNPSVRIKYDERENLIRFNTEMDLIEEYLNAADILKPQKETAKRLLCNLMTMEIGSVIAYFKGRIFKEYSEDEKTAVLQEENLVTLLLGKIPTAPKEEFNSTRNLKLAVSNLNPSDNCSECL